MEEMEGEAERRKREETHRWEREEMREICEGEARDEEERNCDEGDSPHHGRKDRCRKTLKDRWRRGTEEKLGIC